VNQEILGIIFITVNCDVPIKGDLPYCHFGCPQQQSSAQRPQFFRGELPVGLKLNNYPAANKIVPQKNSWPYISLILDVTNNITYWLSSITHRSFYVMPPSKII